jgi:hypothetical protein
MAQSMRLSSTGAPDATPSAAATCHGRGSGRQRVSRRGQSPALFFVRNSVRSSARARASSHAGGGIPCHSAISRLPLAASRDASLVESPWGVKIDTT